MTKPKTKGFKEAYCKEIWMEDGRLAERARIKKLGNKTIKSCQEARNAGSADDWKLIRAWGKKGIFIQDDDAECIDAEGFWKYLLKAIDTEETA